MYLIEHIVYFVKWLFNKNDPPIDKPVRQANLYIEKKRKACADTETTPSIDKPVGQANLYIEKKRNISQ